MKDTRASPARITRITLIALVIVEAILIFGVVVPRILARATPGTSSEKVPGASHE